MRLSLLLVTEPCHLDRRPRSFNGREFHPFALSLFFHAQLRTKYACSVTEQPFKIPYYAALLRLLYDRPVSEEVTTPLGRQVLEDFWKAFREFIDKHAWRETRLCVRFTEF